MSATKHTPGPWATVENHAGDNFGTSRIVVDNSARTESNMICRDVLPHNASLISAAPDLLAACEYLMSQLADLEHDAGDREALAAGRAAIAKARGDQP